MRALADLNQPRKFLPLEVSYAKLPKFDQASENWPKHQLEKVIWARKRRMEEEEEEEEEQTKRQDEKELQEGDRERK